MAYRSSASTTISGASNVVATRPTGILSGDRLVAFFTAAEEGEATNLSPPATWTIVDQSMALGFPFPVLGSICEKKVALGGAADNNTFTIDFGTGQDATVHMVCLRDRHSAQNQVVSTAVSYSVDTDSPFTLETTAVTALARDDAVWLAAVVPQEVLTDQVWSINAPSQFSTRELVVSLSRQITSVLYTRDGLPAGDTGILSGIAALTAGAGVAQYVSQIASVPAGNSFVNASGLRW